LTGLDPVGMSSNDQIEPMLARRSGIASVQCKIKEGTLKLIRVNPDRRA
jgi:hypothetical protein